MSEQTENSKYDRYALASGLTRHYELLSRMAFFSPSLISRPPPTGWDDQVFPTEKLRLLGFKDRVIDLLRHLPYLEYDDDVWPVCVAGEPIRYLRNGCSFSGYADELPDDDFKGKDLIDFELSPFDVTLPQGMVALTSGSSSGGTWWLVDTEKGEIIPYDGWKQQGYEETPDEEPWLWRKPEPFGPFFENIHVQLLSLELIPMPGHDKGDPEIWPAAANDEFTNEARQIYLEHHWPDLERFRRKDCYKKLVELRVREFRKVVNRNKKGEEDVDEDNS